MASILYGGHEQVAARAADHGLHAISGRPRLIRHDPGLSAALERGAALASAIHATTPAVDGARAAR